MFSSALRPSTGADASATDNGTVTAATRRFLVALLLVATVTSWGARANADVPPLSAAASSAGFIDVRSVVPGAVIDLRYAHVTPTGVEALRAALPGCQVEFLSAGPVSTSGKAAPPRGTSDKALAECKADKSWTALENTTSGHAVMVDEPEWLTGVLLQAV